MTGSGGWGRGEQRGRGRGVDGATVTEQQFKMTSEKRHPIRKKKSFPPFNFGKLWNVLTFLQCGMDGPVQNTTSMSLSKLYSVEVIKWRP